MENMVYVFVYRKHVIKFSAKALGASIKKFYSPNFENLVTIESSRHLHALFHSWSQWVKCLGEFNSKNKLVSCEVAWNWAGCYWGLNLSESYLATVTVNAKLCKQKWTKRLNKIN